MASNGQVAVVERSLATIGAYLKQGAVRQQIEAAIPASMRGRLTVDRAIRAAWQTIVSDPEEMAKCTPESIARAIAESALHGLICDGVTGQAYIVRFGNKATFMPGYRGKVALALRGANVESVTARTIFANDKIDVFDVANNEISGHTPFWMLGKDEAGPCLGYYATAKFKTGGKQVSAISYAEVQKLKESIKKRNKGVLSPAWREHEHPMGEKTATHRLGKYLDLDPDASNAFFRDDLLFRDQDGEGVRYEDLDPKLEVPPEADTPKPNGAKAEKPKTAKPKSTTKPNAAPPVEEGPPPEEEPPPEEGADPSDEGGDDEHGIGDNISFDEWQSVLDKWHDRGKLSEKQINRLFAIASAHGWKGDDVKDLMNEHLGCSPSEMPWGEPYDALVAIFENNEPFN